MLNIVLDVIKIFKKKNISWEKSFEKNLIYNYTDFIKKDLPNLNICGLILIILILKIMKIILVIQIILFLYFLLKIIIFNEQNYIKKKLERGFIVDLIINIPKIYSYFFYKNIKNIKNIKLNKKIFVTAFISLNTLYLWGSPRFIINNSFILTGLLLNIIKKNPKSIKISNIATYVKITFLEDTIKKYENTLYK